MLASVVGREQHGAQDNRRKKAARAPWNSEAREHFLFSAGRKQKKARCKSQQPQKKSITGLQLNLQPFVVFVPTKRIRCPLFHLATYTSVRIPTQLIVEFIRKGLAWPRDQILFAHAVFEFLSSIQIETVDFNRNEVVLVH